MSVDVIMKALDAGHTVEVLKASPGRKGGCRISLLVGGEVMLVETNTYDIFQILNLPLDLSEFLAESCTEAFKKKELPWVMALAGHGSKKDAFHPVPLVSNNGTHPEER